MKIKKRLDHLLQERYPALTRNQIQSLIMQGKVAVDGKICTKAGIPLSVEANIVADFEEPQFVCRAGWKLAHALEFFSVDVQGLVVLDAGLSTGGFTHCLLQKGVSRVYGVDVGYGQVHEKIRADTRVVVLEKTNLRHLTDLPEKVDLVTLDLSFISLLKVMPAVINLMKPAGRVITLIKPQFEAQRHEVGKGGIVRDPLIHQRVIESVVHSIEHLGFTCMGVTPSPLTGTMGNKEFLALFARK